MSLDVRSDVSEKKPQNFKDADVRPTFMGHLPAGVRYAKISPGAKVLFSEITALCGVDGRCLRRGGYFAAVFDADEGTVQGWVSELTDIGVLSIESTTANVDGSAQLLRPSYTPAGVDVPQALSLREDVKPDAKPLRVLLGDEQFKQLIEEFWGGYPRSKWPHRREKTVC